MKYPNGTRQKQTTDLRSSHGQRGMSFEKYINESNAYYLLNNIACIHKKPTPIQVIKVEYGSHQRDQKNKSVTIKEAYFKKPSTTDYNGVFRGNYIDFEVKECNSPTTFSLKTLHSHQITHIKTISEMGGIAFILIYFKVYDIVILLDASTISELYTSQTTVSIDRLRTLGTTIPIEAFPVVNYLKYVLILYHEYFQK